MTRRPHAALAVDIAAIDPATSRGSRRTSRSATPRRPTARTRLANARWAEATYPGQGTTFLATDAAGDRRRGRERRSDLDARARLRAVVARPVGHARGAAAGRRHGAVPGLQRRRPGRGQDRLPDRALRGARRGASLPRRARLRGGRADEGGPPGPGRPRGAGADATRRHLAHDARRATRPPAGRPPRRRRGVSGCPDRRRAAVRRHVRRVRRPRRGPARPAA